MSFPPIFAPMSLLRVKTNMNIFGYNKDFQIQLLILSTTKEPIISSLIRHYPRYGIEFCLARVIFSYLICPCSPIRSLYSPLFLQLYIHIFLAFMCNRLIALQQVPLQVRKEEHRTRQHANRWALAPAQKSDVSICIS